MEKINEGVGIMSGKPIVAPHMTPETYEQLKLLLVSPQWRLYSSLLKMKRDGFVATMLPLEEPNKTLKTLGIIVGVDLAIRELGALVQGYENKIARHVAAETKKQRKPAPKPGEKEKENG